MKQWKLRITVFCAGASLMIVELVGSRLVAPFLGSSLIVWTTLIGVILAALSFGYWLGGRIVDQNPTSQRFGAILLVSAVTVAGILGLTLYLGPVSRFGINFFGVAGSTVVCALYLFALPSIIIGMISPYALKLSLVSTDQTGRTAGSLYALSTVGSIVGTFAAGFWLIPTLGSFKTLAAVSCVLAIAGLLYVRRSWGIFSLAACLYGLAITIFLPSIFFPYQSVQAEWESGYNRLFLVPGIDKETNRPIISLMSGPRVAQSARFSDEDNDLVFEYTKFFRRVDEFNPTISKALMIGGGAYSVPLDFLKNHSAAKIDVVEIDPLYTDIARKHFNLVDSDRMNIYHEDGRTFLESHFAYDAIFVDAFNNSGSVPFHLATQEAIKQLHNSLTDNGVVIVNMIGSTEGPGKRFIESELATYQSVFPFVALYPLGKNSTDLQNIMLVATKQEVLSDIAPLSPARILTDDWAPVDYFLSGIL